MSERPRQGETGFTLIELMISLGLFALIAVAGLGMVQGILNVQGRTEKRLDRLADLQRTMFVVTSDLDQIAQGKISGDPQTGLKFTRAAPGFGGPAVAVQYQVSGGVFVRQAGPLSQQVLTGVIVARWRFWDGAWVDRWPTKEADVERWPRAIELEMQVATPPGGGPAGTLRRVIVLPAQASET